MVPIRARSSLSSTGQLMAPGMWSCANSAGERASIRVSNWWRSAMRMGWRWDTGKRGSGDHAGGRNNPRHGLRGSWAGPRTDRESVVEGKGGDLGGGRILKKKKK